MLHSAFCGQAAVRWRILLPYIAHRNQIHYHFAASCKLQVARHMPCCVPCCACRPGLLCRNAELALSSAVLWCDECWLTLPGLQACRFVSYRAPTPMHQMMVHAVCGACDVSLSLHRGCTADVYTQHALVDQLALCGKWHCWHRIGLSYASCSLPLVLNE